MGQQAHELSRVVVIGASVGGADSLGRLVTHFTPSFPTPIVVVAYGSSEVEAELRNALGERAALPIHDINERRELEPGHIYAAFDGVRIQVDGKSVSPIPDTTATPIDALFSSAAEHFGEGVIAVVLSGIGTDGPSGVRTIKERGGTVIVEDPDGEAYPAISPSVPINYIDFASNLESLPDLLFSLASDRPPSADVLDPEVLRAFLAQLRARSGIDFRQYKTPTIIRRLSRLMSNSHCKTLAEYLRYLNQNNEAYQRLISAFLIKVTGFFRDPSLYKHLREQVLPGIIAHAKHSRAELRFWSAGCATGEEAYSLAILLAELLGDEVDELPIRIFATDLDADAISYARRGIYPASAFSSMNPELMAKYFTQIDDAFQVKKRIRNLTVFGEYDLGQRAPFPRIDLILCRNVLIYFTRELQQRTLQLFAFSLRENGYLVLGKAETANPLPQYFTAIDPNLKIFRRQGERLLIPAPAFAENSTLRERPSVRRNALRNTPLPRRHTADPAPRWSLTERLGSFLFDSAIGVVVVDRNYDILTINQSARSLLAIHGQGIGDDLVHLTSAPQLKGWLDAAFRSELPSGDEEFEIQDPSSNETRFLQVACYPDKTANKDGRIEGVIVIVTDATRSVKLRRQLQTENDDYRRSSEQSAVQTEQLLTRQRALMDANNELTAANNELRSANEHLLIAAEEAEASAEEVETLNEEMQATSEELETLNEELQATVEELNTTNEELGARGNDLERIASERQRRVSQLEQLIALYESALGDADKIFYIVRDRRVVEISPRYAALQALNPTLLSAAGEQWREPASELQLNYDDSKTKKYVTSVKSAGDSVWLVMLEPA